MFFQLSFFSIYNISFLSFFTQHIFFFFYLMWHTLLHAVCASEHVWFLNPAIFYRYFAFIFTLSPLRRKIVGYFVYFTQFPIRRNFLDILFYSTQFLNNIFCFIFTLSLISRKFFWNTYVKLFPMRHYECLVQNKNEFTPWLLNTDF